MGSTSVYAGDLSGTDWEVVSFPPERNITDSEILFVAAPFFVDKNLQDGEPRVWRELNVAWDAKFGLAPGGRPTWDDKGSTRGILR